MKICYVLGYGRSGSTLLDMLLGGQPNIHSGGELMHAFKNAWIDNEFCSCGKRGQDCEFWNAVREKWLISSQTGSVQYYVRLKETFEARSGLWLNYAKFNMGSEKRQMYLNDTKLLYKCISEISGKEVIVDSSKLPSRALLLSEIKGIDVRFIHLVRDCRGVCWSLKKAHRKNPEKGVQHNIDGRSVVWSALSWALTNIESELVKNRLQDNKKMLVRYEDLVDNPLKIINEINGFMQLGEAEVSCGSDTSQSKHLMSGNRLRMNGVKEIHSDCSWTQGLSKVERRLIQLIVTPIKYRYGYS